MAAYYNEIDPRMAAWLRELINAGVIAPGVVDERDIRDVRPSELAGYAQCHFFAGIGVWSYALRLAGWADDRPVWTGSCPCQPFSAAGGRVGLADERHLWPSWFHLIQQRHPDVVFGEQVSGGDGLAWLDVVRPDLEGATYSVGCADLCAPGVGAPNLRQRLFFVADADGGHASAEGLQRSWKHRQQSQDGGAVCVADSECSERRQKLTADVGDWDERRREASSRPAARSQIRSMADAEDPRCDGSTNTGTAGATPSERETQTGGRQSGQCEPTRRRPTARSFWTDCDWLPCRDGKARPVEPGTFPLVDGAPARLVRVRGYGNAINAEVAACWIEAYMSIVA